MKKSLIFCALFLSAPLYSSDNEKEDGEKWWNELKARCEARSEEQTQCLKAGVNEEELGNLTNVTKESIDRYSVTCTDGGYEAHTVDQHKITARKNENDEITATMEIPDKDNGPGYFNDVNLDKSVYYLLKEIDQENTGNVKG